jgi:Mrp family chromosome partitioning ATPase
VGVSYVTRLVAQELALENACRVLIGDARTFEKEAPIRGYLELVPGVWTYIDDEDLEGMPDAVKDSIFTNLKPSDFEYVIIDCRAMNETGDALRMARKVDGVFLVVAAGRTKRSQIEHVQGLLQFSTNRLSGLVLNRRTYPIPKPVYKLL